MSKPITVSIPHRLGKDEARRRVEAGLTSVRGHLSSVLHVDEEIWSGDALACKASALGQQTSGTIMVAEDHVRVDVMLPWALGLLAEKATSLIRARGQLMLDKK